MIFSRRLDITPKDYRQRFQETEGGAHADVEHQGQGSGVPILVPAAARRDSPRQGPVAATTH